MAELKILFLGADHNASLDHPNEVKQIEEAIKRSRFRDCVRLKPDFLSQIEDFMLDIAYERPDVLHLSFHGDIQDIYFGAKYQPDAVGVSLEAMELLANACRSHTRLIVLSCCNSSSIAKVLSQSIDYVIGINDEISVNGATNFARAFYSALCSGSSMQEAFEWGKAQLAADGQFEHDMLELHGSRNALDRFFYPDLVTTEVTLTGSALNANILLNGMSTKVRAHYSDFVGITANFDLTNLGKVDIKVDEVFIQFLEFDTPTIEEIFSFYALPKAKVKYKCLLLEKVGRYTCLPELSADLFICLRPSELESFSIEIKANSPGLYKFRIAIKYSQEGVIKELVLPDLQTVLFFAQREHGIGTPKKGLLS